MPIHNRVYLKRYRRNLKNDPTNAESILWKSLQKSKSGFKFRRQHSVGKFIVDFYCAPLRLAVELDGKHHFTPEGLAYDAKRTEYLESLNILVLRFENVRVIEDCGRVVEEIQTTLFQLLRSRNMALLSNRRACDFCCAKI